MRTEAIEYHQISCDIAIKAHPTYLPGHSKPEEGQYIWAYEIEITNQSNLTVQLLNRHWKITNSHGQTFEVRGPGVVGDQPMIRPGEIYSYSSFVNLATPSGFMLGAYEFVTEDGASFYANIPAFSLDSPEELSLPN